MKKASLVLGFLACLVSCEDTSLDLKLIDSIADKVNSDIDFDIASLLARETAVFENFPKSSNALSFDLYREFAKKDGNFTFSPLSISSALTMLYAGAKNETEDALKKTLYFSENVLEFHRSYGDFLLLLAKKDRSSRNTSLELANTLWLQKVFLVEDYFKNILLNAYKAQAVQLDFDAEPVQSTAVINKAIATKTNGEIKELLKTPLSDNTKLLLTNALYFKSKWLSPFEEKNSSQDNFILANGSTKVTTFMRQLEHFSYGADEQKQWLLMPYEDREFATLFILPKEGQFLNVEQNLNANSYQTMLSALERKRVNLWLPKFSERTIPAVKDTLKKLGMDIAFDERANFKGISEKADLYIDDVVHEAVVKMYESGTTAAAATAVVVVEKSASVEPFPAEPIVDFHATRPFLYFIVHKASNTILFMGRVNEPLNNE